MKRRPEVKEGTRKWVKGELEGRERREGGRKEEERKLDLVSSIDSKDDFFSGLVVDMDEVLTLKFTLCHEKGVDGLE